LKLLPKAKLPSFRNLFALVSFEIPGKLNLGACAASHIIQCIILYDMT
jgi:hypothetical protein